MGGLVLDDTINKEIGQGMRSQILSILTPTMFGSEQ